MSEVKASDLAKALGRKGFLYKEGGNHTNYYFYFEGKRTSIRVSISRAGGYVYKDRMLGLIRSEMNLKDVRQLQDFVACRFTQEMYIRHLQDIGVLRP